MRPFVAVLVLSLLFCAGCGLSAPQGKVRREDEAKSAYKKAKQEAAEPVKTESSAEEKAPEKSPQDAPSKDEPAAESDKPETKKSGNTKNADEKKADDSKKAGNEKAGKDKDTVMQKAEVGTGKKGQYGQAGGNKVSDIITVPVATLFRAREMTVFRIQIPEALKLYKAENDNKGPETHEAFMKDIIKKNSLKLPELPDGQEYIYDADKEELMIRKPK
ncbi:MAG: hypothetical protein LBT46_14925 [Planctomycetaceae bacterium]|jgi:hypothetical protein|nr:hypothetical protein [Planctomycetaceae bacterium]